MQITTTIAGADEIVRKLRAVPLRVGRNAMRRALRKGANVIRDAARSNAKALDDNLTREAIWKNIVTQGMGARRQRQVGGVGMRVGVLGGAKAGRGGEGNPGGDTWYWRLVHFGTSEVPARPFLTQAMANGAEKFVSTTVDSMKVEMDKELAKIS